MGGEKCTVQNLKIVAVDLERSFILVKGALPGAKNGVLVLSRSIKKKG